MKFIKTTMAVATLALTAASAAGCGSAKSSAPSAGGTSANSKAVLATISKTPITRAQLTAFVDGTQFMQGTQFPNTKAEQKLELKALVAQTVVTKWVLAHQLTTQKKAEAQAQGIIKTDIKARIGSTAQYKNLLKSAHLTPAALTNYLTAQMLAEAAFAKATKDIKAPSLKQEQAYYQSHHSQFTTPAEDKLSEILVKKESLAKELLGKVKSGTAFASLAKHYSILPSTFKGGSLGYQQVSSTSMGQAMYKAVQNMQVGQYKIYHDTKGYHLIWLESTKPASVQSFTKVKSHIATALTQNLDDQAYQKFVKGLVKGEHIQYAKGW